MHPFREQYALGRLATVRGLIPIASALVVSGLLSDNRKLRDAGYGCAAGWAMSNTVRFAVYAVLGRQRPFVADGDQSRFSVPGGGWPKHSFPAGHSTNAFACSAFLNHRFDLGIAEPALYTAATAISLTRMVDRRHWASDTFVGAAFGYAAGRAIAARFERRAARRESSAGTSPALGQPAGPTFRSSTRWHLVLWEQRF